MLSDEMNDSRNRVTFMTNVSHMIMLYTIPIPDLRNL